MRILALTILASCLFCHTQAQFWLGSSLSNYAGTQALYLNPAFVADTRHKVYVNLVGSEAFVVNNYLGYDAPYGMLKLMNGNVSSEYRGRNGGIVFPNDWISENLNGANKRVHVGADVRGPSALYTFNDKHALALSSRMRAGVSLTDVSEYVAQVMRYGPNAKNGLIKNEAQNQHFTANINGVLEFGLTYGRVLMQDEDWFLKAGISLKRWIGLSSTYLLVPNGSYRTVPDPNNTNLRLVYIDQMQAQFGYTDGNAISGFRLTPEWLLGNRPPGAGWGLDLGFVYEYRPQFNKYTYWDKNKRKLDPTKHKYKYRVSASINDLGRVRYNNINSVNNYNFVGRNIVIEENRFKNIKDGVQFTKALNETIGTSTLVRQTNFSVQMPLALNLNFDSKIKENIYVSALWVQQLTAANQVAMYGQNVLAIVPRYETKWLDVSLPLSLIDNYSRPAVGIAARLGVLTLGTDNMGWLFNAGNQRSLDLYFALSVPIFRKPNTAISCPPAEKKVPTYKRLMQKTRKVREKF